MTVKPGFSCVQHRRASAAEEKVEEDLKEEEVLFSLHIVAAILVQFNV